MNQLLAITTFRELDEQLHGMEYDEFNNWAKEIGLLHNPKNCSGNEHRAGCGQPMKQQKAKGKNREGCWRCVNTARPRCPFYNKDVGFAIGTFFENSKLTPMEIYRFYIIFKIC
jgi:hypothetical protein